MPRRRLPSPHLDARVAYLTLSCLNVDLHFSLSSIAVTSMVIVLLKHAMEDRKHSSTAWNQTSRQKPYL